MNERIKELASKVWYHGNLEEQNENIQIFAELIVKECVGIADEYDGVGSTIVSRIKQHFGVEE